MTQFMRSYLVQNKMIFAHMQILTISDWHKKRGASSTTQELQPASCLYVFWSSESSCNKSNAKSFCIFILLIFDPFLFSVRVFANFKFSCILFLR